VGQASALNADSYLYWQFNYPENEIDYQDYRTFLRVTGVKKREDDPRNRHHLPLGLWFCLSLLNDRRRPLLKGAEKGTEYLREHMRFYDPDENLIYWYHGIKVTGNRGNC